MPGYSAECVGGKHEACTDRDCRCMCPAHPWNRTLPAPPPSTRPAINLVCPQCPRLPRIGDFFCRSDGSKLVLRKRCTSGHPAEVDDVFCALCGEKFGQPTVPVLELSEEEMVALETKARSRPSDVEVPPTEVH